MLVVVCGLPGVGKTTVSEHVAGRVDGELLRTDVVRKGVVPDPAYTDEEERRVYTALFDRAEAALRDGRSVVLDGTFKRATYRRRAKALADEAGVDFDLVKVECAEDIVRERIRARTDDASDADFSVHRLYRETYEPVSLSHATVDNSDGLESTFRQVERRLGRPVRS